jgi:hypothetical protein
MATHETCKAQKEVLNMREVNETKALKILSATT